MKKILLLFGLFFAVVAMAQDKIHVYFSNGTTISYDVTEVDSISLGTSSLLPPSAFKKDGKLPGKFSVSATKQVQFSQGNLQYQASTDTWRFAENHQYDALGKEANEQISATNTGWIDLFGWGTSGYNGKKPYEKSREGSDYGDGRNDIAGTKYDWGVYNKISNGGNEPGKWRTLTREEWEYILNDRTNAEKLRSQASVCGVNGYLLLPDGFKCPDGITFTPQSENFSTNVYNEREWHSLEVAGAVFLPCAGYRNGSDVDYVGSYGNYWSSSAYVSNYAGSVYFDSYYAYVDYYYYYGNGYSVRLATE